MEKKFVSTENQGFNMTFANGLTASVQWGFGNLCDNFLEYNDCDDKGMESNTAEVTVWGTNGKYLDANNFISEKCDSCGITGDYMTPEQVVDFLYAVKSADVSKLE